MFDRDLFPDCGIDGKPEEPVTKHEFNVWVGRILRYHLSPMKEDLGLCKTALYGTPDDPGKGLVNIRDWLCRSAIVFGTIAGAVIAFVLSVIPFVHWIGDAKGWW